MRAWLSTLWERLRSSLWLVPGTMMTIAIALSVGTVALDGRFSARVVRHVGLLWGGSPEGARELLSTIAGSMITVAGVTFSVTIVALSLASSQFGSRVLRNFMRDTGNQVVLGTFIATFVYCLLVLRTVRIGDTEGFVPYISVTTGMALGLASIGVLIYFIHHVSASIQASDLVARIAAELYRSIDRLYPERLDDGEPARPERPGAGAPARANERVRALRAGRSGYVQAIDVDLLLRAACRHSVVLRVARRPGEFVVENTTLVTLAPADAIGERAAKRIARAVVVGRQRTARQDPLFTVQQISQIAVRALSPGINDPQTALICIDWLGAALVRLAQRRLPASHRYDGAGRLRVVIPVLRFDDALQGAFSDIRRHGRSNDTVMAHLLAALAAIASHVRRSEDRAALRRHAMLVERANRLARGLGEHEQLDAQYAETLQAIEEPAGR